MRPVVRLAVALALVAALLFGLSVALRRDPRCPHWVPVPADMVWGPAAQTQGVTSAFPDGLVQRMPVPGAVARGAVPVEFAPGDEEAKRAGRELANPVADSPRARARGEAVWKRACILCHGLAGRGDAPVTLRGMPPPPDLRRAESRALPDGEVFHAITFGRKNMPPARLQVEPEDRWNVIRYLRTLQEAK